MSTETHGCVVCETDFEIDKYGEGKCPICLTAYGYDEGYALVLTSEQLSLLRDHTHELPTEQS